MITIEERLERLEAQVVGLQSGQRGCFARLGELADEIDALAEGRIRRRLARQLELLLDDDDLDDLDIEPLPGAPARRGRTTLRPKPAAPSRHRITQRDLERLSAILDRTIESRRIRSNR